MRINININLRPSAVVRAIEDGVVGAAQLVGRVAKAVPGEVRHRYHEAKIEVAARREAKLDEQFDRMSAAERRTAFADKSRIMKRAIEIRAQRAGRDEDEHAEAAREA